MGYTERRTAASWDAPGGGWPQGIPYRLEYSPDGSALAYYFNLNSAGCYRTEDYLAVWDMQSAEQMMPYSGTILDFAFSPDSRLLAVVHTTPLCRFPLESYIVLWDTASHEEIDSFTFPATKGYPGHLVFSPDGAVLYAAVGSTLYSWTVDGLDERSARELNISTTNAVAFTSDAMVIVDGPQLHYLDPDTGVILEIATLPDGAVGRDVALYPDGTLLATVDADGHARMWRISR